MTERRRRLTDAEKDAIIKRQGGKCVGLPGRPCGKPITRDTAEFDHVDQRVFTKSDNVDEFQALCRGDRVSCASIKTNGIPGAGSAGSDANKRAKARKAKHRRALHAYRMAKKTGGLRHAASLYPEVHRYERRREQRKALARARRELRIRRAKR